MKFRYNKITSVTALSRDETSPCIANTAPASTWDMQCPILPRIHHFLLFLSSVTDASCNASLRIDGGLLEPKWHCQRSNCVAPSQARSEVIQKTGPNRRHFEDSEKSCAASIRHNNHCGIGIAGFSAAIDPRGLSAPLSGDDAGLNNRAGLRLSIRLGMA